ncbi:MAG: patatin-like phospholipase family protein [Xanthomonadaceae bacterium]|nr:patatin-like phospholipase family protein [Xanthomonadaceae bacterium]MDP2185087.1 patatin-like phospholipase family protein [Xanthomonadales bacterium]MDZ4116588.1 patatin-like phospholipase family protein [Xanthomonadaceae bacterium]MDZ4379096.1 patatin-like phospholipase family protein [Xanthomonadaceae bacterium]
MRAQRILSIDGGGIRGVVPSLWLAHLENALAAHHAGPVADQFDLLVGNSTGALVVAGLAAGKRPAELAHLYEEASRAIFPDAPKRVLSRARRIASQGLSAPKFDGRGLDRVLHLVFGDMTLGQLQRPVMLLAFDTIAREPVFFRSYAPEHRDVPVWEALRGSAAAPGYFPAHAMRIGEREMAVIDGGVVANNPALCAIAEALRCDDRIDDPRHLLLLSMGTGRHAYPISAHDAKSWGAMQWAMPLLDVVFDAASDNNDEIARLLVGDGYTRMQLKLAAGSQFLDDASSDNIQHLREQALQHLLKPDVAARLAHVGAQLAKPRTDANASSTISAL